MTRINSRAKGAAAEREFAQLVRDKTGWVLVRNLDQARSGGYDLIAAEDCPLHAFAIEVKRHRTVTPYLLAEWWVQAHRQAIRTGKIPLLCYRGDRGKWAVRLPLRCLSGKGYHDGQAELSLDDFARMLIDDTDRTDS
jgi:Holliday junction resolvase